MAEYRFHPEQSFLARCWWQCYPTPIAAQDTVWPRTDLAPVWVEFDGDGRWDRFWRAEPEGEMSKYLAPHHYHTPQHLFCELFWFGAYRIGSSAISDAMRFEVRPVDRVWMRYDWTLQNRASGLLGFWKTRTPAGAPQLPDDAALWRIDTLDPRQVRTGMRRHNLQLHDTQGRVVSRGALPDMVGLRTGAAGSTLFTLEVLKHPHGVTAKGRPAQC